MSTDKYEFLDEIIEVSDKTLRRIRALRDFGAVKAGDLGGFIQHLGNLSQFGDCWVSDNACVYKDAAVIENAYVGGHARVYDNAVVGGTAFVGGNAFVCGHARLNGDTRIEDSVIIIDHA